jgi:hypothetical protein
MPPGVKSFEVHCCEDLLTQASAILVAEDFHFSMHSDLEM